MAPMQHTVAVWSLALGVICFALYVASTLVALYTALRAPKTSSEAQALVASLSPDQASKVLDSLSKVIDSLAKAGPAVTSLVASILFFVIAAACSGIIQIGSTHTDVPPNGPATVQEGATTKLGG